MADIYRIQVNIKYTKSSGLATWCKNQMAVRYSQAITINEGEKNQERPVNKTREEDIYEIFTCDLPLLNKSHAQDAFNTLSAASVFTQRESGFIHLYKCGHNKIPHAPCETIDYTGEPVNEEI